MNAQIKTSSGKETTIGLTIRTLSAAEKRKNAFKGLGFCWLLSIATAPLPPIHWVTVPGFFLFGFYWFFRKLREGSYVEPFSFPCPECQSKVEVAARPLVSHWEAVCPSCKFSLRIETKAEAA